MGARPGEDGIGTEERMKQDGETINNDPKFSSKLKNQCWKGGWISSFCLGRCVWTRDGTNDVIDALL